MIFSKTILALSFLSIGGTTLAAPPEPVIATYGIHLFFDEHEFVDVMTIEYGEGGGLTGHMHVPNDFDGTLDHLVIAGDKINFDLFVPKNQSRPEDTIFHYEGHFFDADEAQLSGFVTQDSSRAFVASFVGFKR